MAKTPSMTAGMGKGLAELRSRLWFVLIALLVYRIGAHIPVPGINPDRLATLFEQNQGTILGMFNMFSGGALKRMSIFALGIMPYISASIIMQLLTVVSPQLEQLKKEGEAGRRKINQYTRYGTVILAAVQGLGIAVGLASQGITFNSSVSFYFVATITFVCGAVFLMWLGEQITERGIGNGISLLIFAGIVAGLPGALGRTLEQARNGELSLSGSVGYCVTGGCGHWLCGVYGAWSAAAYHQLCQASAGTAHVCSADQPSAVEGEYGRCYSADLRLFNSCCSRHRWGSGLVRVRDGVAN